MSTGKIHRATRSDKGGTHAKRANSRLGRLRQFFENNPDEELSIEDVAIKFDCTVTQAKADVAHLTHEGTLESVRIVRAVARNGEAA